MLAVIILYAADHNVLRDLGSQGRTPTLAALMRRGVTVPIRSDAHQLDGSVYQTLLTGTNPGKHGIHKYRQIVPGTYDYAMSKAERSQVPKIWTVLSDRGRRTCVFDVPKAFATPGFNGKLVGAWGAYSPAAPPGSVPVGLLPQLERRIGVHPQTGQEPLPLSTQRYGVVLNRLLEGIRLREDACRWLLQDGPWDFFITAFSEGHVGSHQFWHLRDSGHPMYDAASAEKYGDAMETLFEAIDKCAGSILECLDDDATIILMSQQGTCNNDTGSHLLPDWLARREGRSAGTRPPFVFRMSDRLGSRARLFVKRRLPECVTNRLVWLKSRPRGDVFVLPGSEFSALLRVNLEGREPAGTVPKAAYRETIETLRDDLVTLRNPATGREAVAEVAFCHDLYHGPCVDQLPDVLVCWKDDRPITTLECPRYGTIERGVKFTDLTHSKHTNEGLAVIAGPDVRAGEVYGERNVMDMTATWYALLGEDPPAHLEGSPIDFSASRRRSE